MTLLSEIYDVTLKFANRSACVLGYIRPTIGESFVTNKDYQKIPKASHAGYTSNKCTGGTVTANIGTSPEGAFNGYITLTVANTWYHAAFPSGESWIQYQFIESRCIEKIRLYSHGVGSGHEEWVSATLQGSNDGVNFTDIHSLDKPVYGEVGWDTFTFTNNTSYTYYRLDVTEWTPGNLGGGANIGEIEMMESVYVTNFSTDYYTEDKCVGGTASASSTVNSNWIAANAFDNGTANYSAWQSVGGGIPGWLTYDFGDGNEKQITKITLTSHEGTQSVYYESMPYAFVLQGSNNNTDWLDVFELDGQVWTDFLQTKFYCFNNNNSYRYYRLYIVDTVSNVCIIGEMEMMEYI